MTQPDQDSPQAKNLRPLIDEEAFRRFGRWWESRTLQETEEKSAAEKKDDREVS